MNNYGMNGSSAGNQYETPFGDVQITKENEGPAEGSVAIPGGFTREFESPFLRTFETGSSLAGLSPFREEYVLFRGELDDHEFGNGLYEMAAELEEGWSHRPLNESIAGENLLPFATRHAAGYFGPLIRASDSMIDRVANRFSGNRLEDHSETEIDRFFGELEFDHSELSPAQEQFFGGLFKKIKSVVKKGVDLAKKGISLAGKFLPIGIILNKLKGLLKPLLEKVLRFAMGKLPRKFQPFAQILAKKLLNIDVPIDGAPAPVHETGYTSDHHAPATGELESIQTELDNRIANLIFSPSESEADHLVMEYESSSASLDHIQEYEMGGVEQPTPGQAREQFINELKKLAPGESPTPAIERFLPGPLMALQPVFKIASSIIGRQKIVNFLAGMLTKLIGIYIPQEIAKPLSTSIVDAGLGFLGFETNEAGRPDLAYEAIASTIQETMELMAGELDETSIHDQETLTAQLQEAFEIAAAHHFPAAYLREDLRGPANSGVWVLKPRRGHAHAYKKYSRVFNILIDPQTALKITTFRSLPLANFLRDKLGLDPCRPIQAKVHLFEAVDGTKLSQIAHHEDIPGLGGQPHGWIQLHPLTPDAATLLLREPGLGKDFPVEYTTKRTQIALGQRFYELEINGARMHSAMIQPGHHHHHRHQEGKGKHHHRPPRSADVHGVLDFVKGEIRLDYYFSEVDAKSIVEKLNANDFAGAASGIRHSVRHVLHRVLIRHLGNKVKIIHESMPELYLEHYSGQEEAPRHAAGFGHRMKGGTLDAGKELLIGMVRKLIGKISHSSYQSIVDLFKTQASGFKQAQAEKNDGVTIKLTWKNITGMAAMRTVITAIRSNQPVNNLGGLSLPEIPAPAAQILAGKHFD